jgi:glycosyltransferase involved in cell wall biosynthesis
MNILYIADPNSIHDLKWISRFTQKRNVKAFILPREIHRIRSQYELPKQGVEILRGIPDFSIVRFYRTLLTAYHIKRFVKRNKIDIIHILYAEPNALWCLFKRYFNLPMIISSRGTDVLKTIPGAFEKKNFINYFVSRAYKRAFIMADFVTGTSGNQLDSIKKFSTRTQKIALVRTGVDIKRLMTDTSRFFPLTTTRPYIFFPRYIKPLYNHDFCLDAISFFPPEIKGEYQMVFVGKDHYEADRLYQSHLETRMKSMQDVGFIFLPEMTQESIFELNKRSSLVVMTPLSDGSPVSAMEAIACGAKVILGPIKYDEEIFERWTFKLNSWDSKELSALMIHCLAADSNPDIKTFTELVDRNKEMDKMERIYQKIFK